MNGPAQWCKECDNPTFLIIDLDYGFEAEKDVIICAKCGTPYVTETEKAQREMELEEIERIFFGDKTK